MSKQAPKCHKCNKDCSIAGTPRVGSELNIWKCFNCGYTVEEIEYTDIDQANTDRLSNFKLAGGICGLKAEQNCLSLIATKVARLGVLLNSDKAPNNESIQDSVLDLANYSILLSMILNDK